MKGEKEKMKPDIFSVDFLNERRETLRGFLHLPSKKIPNGLVMAPGFMNNCAERKFVETAKLLFETGITCLRFDFSGCGNSDGVSQDINISSQINELLAARAFLLDRDGVKPGSFISHLAFMGHSLGALITLLAVARLEAEFKNSRFPLILLAPAVDQKNISQEMGWFTKEEILEAMQKGMVDKPNGLVGKWYIEQLGLDWFGPIGLVRSPILIIHGDRDDKVPARYSQVLMEKLIACQDKHLEILPGVDHKMESGSAKQAIVSLTLDWLNKHFAA